MSQSESIRDRQNEDESQREGRVSHGQIPHLESDIITTASTSKTRRILDACQSRVDPGELRELATSEHGLLEDQLRKIAWPLLLGVPIDVPANESHESSWRDLPPHKDEEQVRLDVGRSFVYYPQNLSEKDLENRRNQLSDLIIQLLREHPMLCYFQGFHDVVQVFLLVLGFEQAGPAVAYVSLLRIRDFMLPSLNPSLVHLRLLPIILSAVDPTVEHHLSAIRPYFALSSTLTMYAHDIQEYSDIARLFDFLLAQPAIVSIYLFATIILHRKSELLEIPQDEPDVLHVVLSKLPKTLNLDALISRTMDLLKQHPPDRLRGREWRRVSRYSVLKTTGPLASSQSLQDGEILFRKQMAEVKNQEKRKRMLADLWQLRRPMGLGFAVFVGILAIWLRKGNIGESLGPGIMKLSRVFLN